MALLTFALMTIRGALISGDHSETPIDICFMEVTHRHKV